MLLHKMMASMIPFMPKKLVWIFSKRYIAGETIEDAIKESKELNKQGIKITVDLLGEFIDNIEKANESMLEYLDIIDTFEKNKIDGNYSLKPTSFGLLLDKDIAYDNIRKIVAKAASYNNFVRIDMEDSPCTDLEIELFRKLKKEFPTNVGLVFQAYMKRTLDDIKKLEDIHDVENSKNNYRLCKGIYVEPKEIAFKKFDEVNENFLIDLDYMLEKKMYPGIATHDKALVDGALKLLKKHKPAKEDYEFQMLLGVTPELRKSIVDEGHTMRVYVPFGKDWFGYSSRRLKENPEMLNQIIKSMFFKG